jgi:hypothetical protein
MRYEIAVKEKNQDLEEKIRQFEEMRTFSDHMRLAVTEALPMIGTSSKTTKVEMLAMLLKKAATKYGTDKAEAS